MVFKYSNPANIKTTGKLKNNIEREILRRFWENFYIKKSFFIPSDLDQLSIRLIYSSGIKLGNPSAEATATHITAEELPLFAIV